MIIWNAPIRCDNSGPNCAQIGTDEAGNITIRDTERPAEVVTFAPAAWAALTAAIRGGTLA